MNIRENTEHNEKILFSEFACLSVNSEGRREAEDECSIRTAFQKDRDRILHSKSFRRLKHKTQVFIAPEGDHYRTRLTHTLEVAQIARTIARGLRLNEDLIEAISLGHDLGHTPFGHIGERVLDSLNPEGFKHYEQSLRVVDFLESRRNKRGLNLTEEVRDGILNHSGLNIAKTLEGKLVKYADRIAYINHDIDDAIRAGVISFESLPKELLSILGNSHGDRINTMILDIIEFSYGSNKIGMSPVIQKATDSLREFMFENVYFNKLAKSQEDKAKFIISELYAYYSKNFNKFPKEHLNIYSKQEVSKDRIITDYIAGTTDRYIINLFNNIFVPKPWREL